MASISARALGASQPNQSEYLSLLRDECRCRGLVDWRDEITTADIMACVPFDSYRKTQPLHHSQMTPDQWLDLKNYPPAFAASDQNNPIEESLKEVRRDEDRRTLLEKYAKMHLDDITEKTKKDFIAAGGKQERLEQISDDHPVNTILYWLAELWNRQNGTSPATKIEGRLDAPSSTRSMPSLLQEIPS